MTIKSAAQNLFKRFNEKATLGPGAQRTDIPDLEDTQMNIGLTQAFLAIAELDGSEADRDERDGFIKTPAAEVAVAALAPQYAELDLFKDLMSEDDYAESKSQLEQLKAEAQNRQGESTITIERPSEMESVTTIETPGTEPNVEVLYASLGGKVYLDITGQGDQFTAEATVLPLGGQAFTEKLSGGWELAQ